MNDYGFVADNVLKVEERIAAATARAGRQRGEISLMAVSKFHPLGAVDAAYAAGMRLFGESRVQEAESKFETFLPAHPDASLELIGSLQSNKAKRAVALFSTVQSVDSLELLGELKKRATAAGRRIGVLLELHTGEESKSGFPSLEGLLRACDFLAAAGNETGGDGAGLEPRGLMTMAPYTKETEPIRASFRSLKAAFHEIDTRFSFPSWRVLSMGMTNDYEIAVEEGSTLLRVGTALFGPRPAP
jgi:pyridoxal phosphate enzyme (YggS family)